MVFSGFNFLFLFLPALLIVYYAVPARFAAGRNGVLLLFSLVFYACGGVAFLPLMLVSSFINWAGGLLAAPGKAHRKAFFLLTLILDLSLLGWFKYAGFLAQNLAALGLPVPVPEITLPIGISFFTFQGMSYLFDVRNGTAPPERSLLRVTLYIALFPQLIAGPIVRYTDVADALRSRRENFSDFTDGVLRFLFGLAKKMLLANLLAELADEVFSGTAALSAASAWLGALAYTAQIYFDFSGYSDMAIGLGRMFGFRFPENFNYPYIARSVTEFWRRWHMSLSGWFRDYVYFPLGGSRCSAALQIRNLLIVWLLTGLWHGAAWNFVFWGLYFALLLMGERFLWGSALSRAPRALQHLYALLLVVLSWVLFRADTLPRALELFAAMFGAAPLWDIRTEFLLRQYGPILLIAAAACLPLRPALEKHLSPSGLLRIWGTPVLAFSLFVLCYVRLAGSSFNPFIYFRF